MLCSYTSPCLSPDLTYNRDSLVFKLLPLWLSDYAFQFEMTLSISGVLIYSYAGFTLLVSKFNYYLVSTFGLTRVVWWKYMPLRKSETAVQETCVRLLLSSIGMGTDTEVLCMISLESACCEGLQAWLVDQFCTRGLIWMQILICSLRWPQLCFFYIETCCQQASFGMG